jgi:hypothetical protein
VQRGEVRQRHHRGAALTNDVLEGPGGLLEERGGPRLADRDGGAGGEGAVEALEDHQVAAVVHDGDGASGRAEPPRLADGGGGDQPRRLQGQRLLVHDLTVRGADRAEQHGAREHAGDPSHDGVRLSVDR